MRSDELRDEIIRRYGVVVQLMQLNQGIFDAVAVSLLSLATSHKITNDSVKPPDIRRFRNCAGVFGTVIRLGALAVGQTVYLR